MSKPSHRSKLYLCLQIFQKEENQQIFDSHPVSCMSSWALGILFMLELLEPILLHQGLRSVPPHTQINQSLPPEQPLANQWEVHVLICCSEEITPAEDNAEVYLQTIEDYYMTALK